MFYNNFADSAASKNTKGNELMARYEFTPNLETGNAMIDKEHRELIAAVHRLLDACSDGKALGEVNATIRFLNDYVDRHFLHEEQLQQQSGYPSITSHKAFHESYKKTLKEITSGISSSGASIGELMKLNTHISLLITHIKTEDKKLGAFLNSK